MQRVCTIIIASLALSGASAAQDNVEQFYGGPPEVPGFEPAFDGQWRAPIAETAIGVERTVVADGLAHPWGLAELPDGALLVTERPGRLRVVTADGTLSDPLSGVPEVYASGQGGLLDVVLAPDFEETREVFFTFAEPRSGGESATAVARARLSQDRTALEGTEVIFRQQPAWDTIRHYGSRIVFQDNETMFVGLGEYSLRAPRQLAQDTDSHIGTVIRIHRDGSVPQDNPFADGAGGALPEIWSYGHRNIQAADLHPETGALWTIEHGPQGGDEVNVPKPGLNYGWPVITYGENYGGGTIGPGLTQQEGMEQPVYFWSPVIAPSGAAFYDGDLFPEWQGDLLVGGLRAATLVRLEIDGERVVAEDRLVRGIGRVRDVRVAADGSILLALDAGNGSIVRLTPAD